MARNAENHERLVRMTPLERAEDRLDFLTLLAEIFAAEGCYQSGLLQAIYRAERAVRSLRNRKAK